MNKNGEGRSPSPPEKDVPFSRGEPSVHALMTATGEAKLPNDAWTLPNRPFPSFWKGRSQGVANAEPQTPGRTSPCTLSPTPTLAKGDSRGISRYRHIPNSEAPSNLAEGLVCIKQPPQRDPIDVRLYFLGSEPFPRNALNRSMGIGNTTMLVRSVAISFSVPR